jgi:cell fate regulator YaaT (PSP1 superfamily)
LVRLLAAELQTRIEMRQIGVRDEAKLLADYGDCGKATCCNSHLVEMPPVSMRMAKMQKATLDPTKISGRCGRLKCCLRYEYDLYERQELPLVQLDNGQLGHPAVPVEADEAET